MFSTRRFHWKQRYRNWFGLGKVNRPNVFPQRCPRIGDPDSDIQIFFIVTDNPSKEKAVELRNTVVATVFDALA